MMCILSSISLSPALAALTHSEGLDGQMEPLEALAYYYWGLKPDRYERQGAKCTSGKLAGTETVWQNRFIVSPHWYYIIRYIIDRAASLHLFEDPDWSFAREKKTFPILLGAELDRACLGA